MFSGQQLLVVDGLTETKEVLKAVFEPRGLNVNRVRGDVEQQQNSPPNLVVLHEDAPTATHWKHVPRVVIGSKRFSVARADACYLRAPFQYPELIQAIESMLDKS